MKTTKILKTIVAIAMIAMFSLTLTSCGGGEDDPKPVTPTKTDLELVKEGIIGNWKLQSIAVTKDGVTETYNGGCDESTLDSWAQANVADIDFNFTSSTNVDEILSCTSQTVNAKYTVSEDGGKFYISMDNGFKVELITSPSDISGSTVKANYVGTLIDGISKSVWTFTK